MGRYRPGQFADAVTHPHLFDTRGRGVRSPAARYFLPLVLAAAFACGGETREEAPNAARTIVAEAGNAADAAACAAFPDTAVELLAARQDQNDLPLTRIVLDAACPRATVWFNAGARIQRTYRVPVRAGQTLLARARGESGPVVLTFDYPAAIAPDSANYGMSVVDSIRVDADREVSVRVMLIPRAKDDARASRVLLTVLARP